MFFVTVAIGLGVSAAAGSVAWVGDGDYVSEDLLYQLRCVSKQEQLCAVLDISQHGYLRASGGVLRYALDGECGNLVFSPTTLTRDAAEGVFVAAGDATAAQARETSKYVQLWADADALVLRGPIDTLGHCESPQATTAVAVVRRFVPRPTLWKAAAEKAREIGASVSECKHKTTPSFRAGPCLERISEPR